MSAHGQLLHTRLAIPSPPLQPVVWCYGQSDGRIETAPLVVPLPARPKQVMTFFFGDSYRTRPLGSARLYTSPSAMVVGPQTSHRLDLSVMGRIDTFTIHFQPAGFHHLFGVDMDELADASFDVPSVLGSALSAVARQMADARSFGERIHTVEPFLLNRLRAAGSMDAVGATANWLFASQGRADVTAMAARCGLTRRQLERRFLVQVGVSPKRYARIVRFAAAIDAKLRAPHRTWSAIAHEMDYHDQMHMVHDFQQLAGDTPSRFMARVEAAPEFRTAFAMSLRPDPGR